jgi:hypothetical protein
MLSSMFGGRFTLEPSMGGSYFIDRDGTHFRWILNYLRDHSSIDLLQDKQTLLEVLREAKYYYIFNIERLCQLEMNRERNLHFFLFLMLRLR